MSQPLPKGGDENDNGKGQKKVSNKKGGSKKGKAAAKLSVKKR